MRFIESLIRWLRGSQPLASLPIIEIRHMACENCPALKKGWLRRFCQLCGCTISRRRWPFNKLAMPEEKCPINRWQPVTREFDS